MTMRSRLLPQALTGTLLLVCFFGCLSPPSKSMRIGISPWTGYEPFFIARERRLFDQTRIKLVDYTSNTESSRAFRNGALDAAALTLDEAAKLAYHGMDIKVVLVIDFSNGGDVLLGHPEMSGIRDLAGKKIGLEATSLGDYMLIRALETAGMRLAEVQLVPLDNSEQERAFKEGRVDAVVTYEPVRTKLLATGARNLFDSSRIPMEIVDVLVVKTEFLQEGGKEVEMLLKGWFAALQVLQKEDQAVCRFIAGREGISEAESRASLLGLQFPGLGENRYLLSGTHPGLLPAARRLVENMSEHNLISGKVDLAFVLDGNWVSKVVP